MDLQTPAIKNLLDLWLNEDLGRGDLTRVALTNSIRSAHWISKQKGVFCGGYLVEQLFHKIDQRIEIEVLINDGEQFESGQRLLNLKGPTAALLAGERTGLNIAMHLSGIATATAKLVKELEGTGIRLADTRKTTPGLRILEKYAVRCGGGTNHRMGLDDAAMLKENHIAWAHNIESSIAIIRDSSPWPTRIIVEAETPQQAEEAVKGGADGILLDDMSIEVIRSIVPRLRALARADLPKRVSNHIFIEVSGIDPSQLKSYTSTGIDIISTSAPITKSNWIDFSMRFTKSTAKK